MPDFNVNSPLKRGRIIGQGLRPCCRKNIEGCTRNAEDRETMVQSETTEE